MGRHIPTRPDAPPPQDLHPRRDISVGTTFSNALFKERPGVPPGTGHRGDPNQEARLVCAVANPSRSPREILPSVFVGFFNIFFAPLQAFRAHQYGEGGFGVRHFPLVVLPKGSGVWVPTVLINNLLGSWSPQIALCAEPPQNYSSPPQLRNLVIFRVFFCGPVE